MEKKYELTDIITVVNGHVLHRIKALKDFGDVRAGALGGLVESEENLSQSGLCWIYLDAKVYEHAEVYGDAQVHGKATICGDAAIYENADISGTSVIRGCATIRGCARIYGDAMIYDYAEIHGMATICDNAIVHGMAQIYGCAELYGEADVYSDAQIYAHARITGPVSSTKSYLCIGPIGSRDDFVTFIRNSGKIEVNVGCFSGTLDEFKRAVRNAHRLTRYGKEYRAAIKFAKRYFAI